MKIRTDFVTNSSSSSFILEISFELTNGQEVSFNAHGGTDEAGRTDYFDSDAVVTVSPKQLGEAGSVDKLITLLQQGVTDGWPSYEEVKLFEKPNPVEVGKFGVKYDAYDFIKDIRSKIKSMDDIESVTITGNEYNYISYLRTYSYNRKTKAYTGTEKGVDFDKDGSSGGDLRFLDLAECQVFSPGKKAPRTEESKQNGYKASAGELAGYMSSGAQPLAGLKFCVTGYLDSFPESGPFPTRKKLKEFIEYLGGKLVISVSSVTNYLICNDAGSGTSKIESAKYNKVPVITEKEFFDLVKRELQLRSDAANGNKDAEIDLFWKYKKKSSGKMAITGYFGSETEVVVPGSIHGVPVDEIADRAFSCVPSAVEKHIREKRMAIEKIQLPDGIKIIDEFAFRDCKNLVCVSLPGTLDSIGLRAFAGCKSLTEITLPDSVKIIGGFAFEDCKKLASVNIGSGVEIIEPGAFANCKGLKSICISEQNPVFFGKNCIINHRENALYAACAKSVWSESDSIFYIKEYAFSSCRNLKALTLPTGLKEIGGFNECTALNEITIPVGVISIGDGAFSGCENLKNITIPDSVTSIGDRAFSGCKNLNNFTIPDSVTSIGDCAFSGCKNLTDIVLPAGVAFIGEGAFAGSGIMNIVLPYGITVISERTFEWCINLKHISIPKTVQTIGKLAFWACSGMTHINIPNSVINFEYGAFSKCSSLTSVTIPDSVTSIGESAFSECSDLTSVTIPDSVTSIGESAFQNCGRLNSINLPDSLNADISHDAFDGTGYEKNSSNWEDGVLYIGRHLISVKYGLTGSYSVRAGTKSIADFLSDISSITIPESVTHICCKPRKNFRYVALENVRQIILDENNKAYSMVDGVLFTKDMKTLVRFSSDLPYEEYVIPDSVTEISAAAFCGCRKLRSVKLPDGITSIADSTFSGCSSLADIVIPESVEKIGEGAFAGCEGLYSVIIPDSVTWIDDFAFGNCKNLASIMLPGGLKKIGRSILDKTAYSDDSSNWDKKVLYSGEYLLTAKGDLDKETGISGDYAVKEGTRVIANDAFLCCRDLVSVTIPDSVTEIGYEDAERVGSNPVFDSCYGLTVIGSENSAAQKYAQEHRIKFKVKE